MSRVDYSISDNTKLFVRYNLQREVQLFPIGLWSSATAQQVPYPTPIQGKNRSDSVTASLTHVFSSSMTNEFVFGYTFIGFPNVFQDPSKVDRTKVGYNYKGLFKNGVAQIPHFGGAAGEAALVFNQGGFEVGGPSAGCTPTSTCPASATRCRRSGESTPRRPAFFWEHIRNAQPANNTTNGQLQRQRRQLEHLGNPYADMLVGNLNSLLRRPRSTASTTSPTTRTKASCRIPGR